MKTASISETKNQLGALLDRERLAWLERAGVIRRARRGRLGEIVRVLPPAPEAGGDIVDALLEERRSGR